MPKILEEFKIQATTNLIKAVNDTIGSENIHLNIRDLSLQKFLGIRVDTSGAINFDGYDGSTWFEQIQLDPGSRSLYFNQNVIIGTPGGPTGYGYGYGEEGASIGSLVLYGDLYVDDDAVFAEDIVAGARIRLGGIENNDLENGDFWLDESSGRFSFRQNDVTIVLPDASPIDGGGVANEVTFWSDPNTITSDSDFTYDPITNKLTVGGLVDSIGLDLTPRVANPGATPTQTLWISNANGHLYRGTVDVEAPAGADTQVQFNNSGNFGANANFYYLIGTGLRIANGTGSTESTSGALVVSGGIGIGGRAHIGDTTDPTLGTITSGAFSIQGGVRIGGGQGGTDASLIVSGETSSTLGNYAVGSVKYKGYFYGQDDIADNDVAAAVIGHWSTVRPGFDNGEPIGVLGISDGNDGAEQGGNATGVKGIAAYGSGTDNRDGTRYKGMYGLCDMQGAEMREVDVWLMGGWFQGIGQKTNNVATDRNVYGVRGEADFVTDGSFDWTAGYGGYFEATGIAGVDYAYGIYAKGIGADVANYSARLVGPIWNDAADFHYFGDPTTDGSWRFGRNGNDFIFQRRESSSWVTKQTITP